jgi:endonuclease YncB( thermonuclease family)
MTINKIVALILTTLLNLLGFSIVDRAAPIDGNYRVVERVIDGDTLVMDSGERVRLIGG